MISGIKISKSAANSAPLPPTVSAQAVKILLAFSGAFPLLVRALNMGTTDAISPDVRDRNSVGDVHVPAYCPQLITKLGDQV